VLLLERVAVLEGVVILEGVAVEDVAVTLLEDLADERSTTCDVDAMNTVVGHSIQETIFAKMEFKRDINAMGVVMSIHSGLSTQYYGLTGNRDQWHTC
jgi:hypothetical protein